MEYKPCPTAGVLSISARRRWARLIVAEVSTIRAAGIPKDMHRPKSSNFISRPKKKDGSGNRPGADVIKILQWHYGSVDFESGGRRPARPSDSIFPAAGARRRRLANGVCRKTPATTPADCSLPSAHNNDFILRDRRRGSSAFISASSSRCGSDCSRSPGGRADSRAARAWPRTPFRLYLGIRASRLFLHHAAGRAAHGRWRWGRCLPGEGLTLRSWSLRAGRRPHRVPRRRSGVLSLRLSSEAGARRDGRGVGAAMKLLIAGRRHHRAGTSNARPSRLSERADNRAQNHERPSLFVGAEATGLRGRARAGRRGYRDRAPSRGRFGLKGKGA